MNVRIGLQSLMSAAEMLLCDKVSTYLVSGWVTEVLNLPVPYIFAH